MQRVRLILFVLVVIVLLGVVFWLAVTLQKFFNPTITFNMSSKTVIKELRALNRLETASFTIEKVIDAGTSGNRFQELLYGDRILLIAHGEVIAGFDLANLKDNDIDIRGTQATLTLPPPQILVTSLDNNETRVYDRKQGLLTKGDKNLESQARLAATNAISDAACNGKILDQASNNARKQLAALLKTLGFVTVIINIPQGNC